MVSLSSRASCRDLEKAGREREREQGGARENKRRERRSRFLKAGSFFPPSQKSSLCFFASSFSLLLKSSPPKPFARCLARKEERPRSVVHRTTTRTLSRASEGPERKRTESDEFFDFDVSSMGRISSMQKSSSSFPLKLNSPQCYSLSRSQSPTRPTSTTTTSPSRRSRGR